MKTPPAEFYIDPARLKAERERIFARSWQIVGHVGQLANPGDYFTTRLGNEPLLFTNDGGTIHGFFNVCRHRAGPIAYGCGKAQRLVCRYHGWTYDLGGQLLRTMEMEGAEEFDPTQIRLQSVKVHRFGPLLLAALDPDTPPFEELYPGVRERCEPLGLERMGLPRKNRRRPGVLLLAVSEPDAEHLRRTAAVERRDSLDADNTLVRFEWFALEPLSDPQTNARWTELSRFSEEVQAEDAHICEAVQFNLHSRAYRSGPYSPKRERGVRLFHTLMQHS